MFDADQAADYMQLAAWELAIGSCLATIYQHDDAKALLGIHNDLHINIAISFGYPQDHHLLSSPTKKDGRKPITDVVHW